MKRALVLGLGLVAGLALPIACSFPQLGYDTGAGASSPASGPGPGSGGSATTSPSSSSAGAGMQSGTGASGGGGSSSTTGTAGGTSTGTSGGGGGDGGPPCLTSCDCDNDGEMSIACGGLDCADYDHEANTGFNDSVWHPYKMTGPLAPGTDPYDWDCSGTAEHEWDDVCVQGTLGYTCTTPGKNVWKNAAPDCGAEGETVACKSNGLGGGTCKPTMTLGPRTQACH